MKAKLKSKLNLEKHTPLQDVIPLQSPFLIYIDPSSVCNFHCKFCPSGHKEMINRAGYTRNIMRLNLFNKIIRDLGEFENPVKVVRMNKIGEPFLNKNLAEMVASAKQSGRVERVELATNGSLFSPKRLLPIFDAGLDQLDISVEGINREQYLEHVKYDFNFDQFVENVHWLYANKMNCEVTIKIPGNYLSEDQKKEFLNVFGDYCDRIFIEDLSPIWPLFDLETYSDFQIKNTKGQYKQSAQQKAVCTYIFYSLVINADGTVSACCPDWEQKLIVGDVRVESLKNIWHSPQINAIRRRHLEGKRTENEVCRDCGHITYAQVDNIDPFMDTLLQKFLIYEKECL